MLFLAKDEPIITYFRSGLPRRHNNWQLPLFHALVSGFARESPEAIRGQSRRRRFALRVAASYALRTGASPAEAVSLFLGASLKELDGTILSDLPHGCRLQVREASLYDGTPFRMSRIVGKVPLAGHYRIRMKRSL